MKISKEKASPIKTFRVYFSDGNQRLYEAQTITLVCNHISIESINDCYGIRDVVKIEEVQA